MGLYSGFYATYQHPVVQVIASGQVRSVLINFMISFSDTDWLAAVCFFSIMNSLVIVLFLSGMVAMIMLRTLHKDIARYNQVDQVGRIPSHRTWAELWLCLLQYANTCIFCNVLKWPKRSRKLVLSKLPLYLLLLYKMHAFGSS